MLSLIWDLLKMSLCSPYISSCVNPTQDKIEQDVENYFTNIFHHLFTLYVASAGDCRFAPIKAMKEFA